VVVQAVGLSVHQIHVKRVVMRTKVGTPLRLRSTTHTEAVHMGLGGGTAIDAVVEVAVVTAGIHSTLLLFVIPVFPPSTQAE
jgi:hypothetical protein